MKSLIPLCCLWLSTVGWCDDAPPILIRWDTQSESLKTCLVEKGVSYEDGQGVVVWGDDRKAKLEALPLLNDRDLEKIDSDAAAQLRNFARSSGDSAVLRIDSVSELIDQFQGIGTVRNISSLISPTPGSRFLKGIPTIRRIKEGSEKSVEVKISRNNQVIITTSFLSGQTKLLWKQMSQGTPYEDGLPSGPYTIQVADEASFVFYVEEKDVFPWVEEPVSEFSILLKDSERSAILPFQINQYLHQQDDNGKPFSYWGDTLDILDAPENLTLDYSVHQKQRIIQTLHKGESTSDSDGDADNDLLKVRGLIESASWKEASEKLSKIKTDSPRVQSLQKMYYAVIEGESVGASDISRLEQTEKRFEEVVTAMETHGTSDDQARAKVNFANFLMMRAQQQLYNQTLIASTGVENSLYLGAKDLVQSRKILLEAKELSQLSAENSLAIEVSLIRPILLAGDLVSLAADNEMTDRLAMQYQAILKHGKEQAVKVYGMATEPIEKGIVKEIESVCDYRLGNPKDAIYKAQESLAHYIEGGSLAGMESAYRTLGFLYEKLAGQSSLEESIRCLKLSNKLGETLRSQFSQDQYGLAKAGFSSRRTFVQALLVEQLIRNGQIEEALEMAEAAKSRSLSDMLFSSRIRNLSSDLDLDETELLHQVTDDVPQGTYILEYFLGPRQCWVFGIGPGRNIIAEPICHPDGRPMKAWELVGPVVKFLHGMNGQARKLLAQASRPDGFDKSWQNTLSSFFQTLLPKKLRENVLASERLIVVPHHVLHYFPFACLVTQLDDREVPRLGLPQPKFLVELLEEFATVPSLTTLAMLRQKNDSSETKVNSVGIVNFQGAPSLPGVRTDLDNLQRHFKNALGTAIEGDAATEVAVTNLLQESGLLFLATHGYNQPENPLKSFLMTHPTQNADGLLTAEEIFQHGTQADLVVMSACYSGLADRSPASGDDLFGIQRAFLHGGAKNVVSGMWDVYDGTGPILMDFFFENLRGNLSVSASLTKAQKRFIEDRRTKGVKDPWIHPYFWAVYNSTGSDQIHVSNP